MLWMLDPLGDPPAFEIDAVLLKPRSRGTVRLRSADPRDAPRIELPGLRDPSDLDRLVEAHQRALDVADRPEIRRHCATAATPRGASPAEVRRIVEENSYSVPHTVGTCAMGPSPDDGAVVDASGRVHGTEGLFVVDASIIPEPPSGFPHIITIMLAERLAERMSAG